MPSKKGLSINSPFLLGNDKAVVEYEKHKTTTVARATKPDSNNVTYTNMIVHIMIKRTAEQLSFCVPYPT